MVGMLCSSSLPGIPVFGSRCHSLLDHWVFQHTQPLDFDANDIPRLQVLGWVTVGPHPTWRTRRDDIPRLQRDRLGNVMDQERHTEDEVPRVRALPQLAVHVRPYVEDV